MRLSDSRSFPWIEGWTGDADADVVEEEERLLLADLRRVKIYSLVGLYTRKKRGRRKGHIPVHTKQSHHPNNPQPTS